MKRTELQSYLHQPESTRLEFKTASNKMPDCLFETVAGFLNREGGRIILGVDDQQQVIGIDKGLAEKLSKDIITASSSPDLLNPPYLLSPQIVPWEDKVLMYIQVPVSSQVHQCRGDFFDRENDSDIRITGNDHIGDLFFRKRNQFSERTLYPALTMGDLSLEGINKAKKIISGRRPDHPWLRGDDMRFLRLSGLYRKDFQTGEEGFTLASALLFGKDSVIQSVLPAYKIEAMVRIRDRERYDDRLSLRTNLLDSYTRLMQFFRTHLPDRFFLEKDQRIDLRELIFREIVANVIVHREYTNASPSSLVIYDDRVEVSNPNTVRFRGYLDPTNFQPYPKNPLISKLFIELGWAEEIGSGIINVNKYLPHYADGESPTFIEEDQFRTILPLKRNTFEHRAPWVWEFLGFTPSQESKMALTQLSLPQALTLSSSQSEFLFSLAAKWLLEGGKLPDLRMLTVKQAPTLKDWNHTSYPTKGTKLPPSKSAHTGSKRNVAQAKDTSWGAKGTKLYGKRMIILMTVLGELLSPTSMEDLIAQLGYSNRRSFMDTYIKPLMKYQLIERTIPDTPRHPDQKYRSSAKGRRFLGGFEL